MNLVHDLCNQPTSHAILSKDRVYRYALLRQWNMKENAKAVTFIGLNPSTADETTDDPTVRRCVGFAKKWGFDAMAIVNLFAFRATSPKEMMRQADPVGRLNDWYIQDMCKPANADEVIACWGNGGLHLGIGAKVEFFLGSRNAQCFGRTKTGQPKHPLYLAKDEKLVFLNLPNPKS